ncbi:uncharacterized protein LOC142226845 isoform X2 [Haematobia irritans]|uniref:uncharacterized protein LOC142226845 isoform X2 n=1 Tax=Haematobia irritans TaxID=7368 RepID=UPI003F50BF2D
MCTPLTPAHVSIGRKSEGNVLDIVITKDLDKHKYRVICAKKEEKVLDPKIPVEEDAKPPIAVAMHTNQELEFIPGQRGKNLLLYQNYTYSKNNSTGSTIYWKCRTVRDGNACNARVTTFLRPNGLYNICLTKPHHNHQPTSRLGRKAKPKAEDPYY